MHPRSLLIEVLLLSLFTLLASAQNPRPDVKFQVVQVLESQQAAWNRHDLEGFMAGYWNSPELTFFSGAKMNSGWESTLDHYRKTYQSDGREMGKLEFSELNVQELSPDAAFVRGAWKLTIPDAKGGEKNPHGLFTLVFRKFPGGWRIIHDHTSTAE